jgi:hypothetical protein
LASRLDYGNNLIRIIFTVPAHTEKTALLLLATIAAYSYAGSCLSLFASLEKRQSLQATWLLLDYVSNTYQPTVSSLELITHHRI